MEDIIMRINRSRIVALLLILVFLATSACVKEGEDCAVEPGKSLRLATTTTTVDSGLFSVLIPIFESRSGIKVEVLATGSGRALDMGRSGKADVLLIHARKEEDKFNSEGYGLNRRDVMYNDFVILGPPEDPAQLRKETDMAAVFDKIAKQSARFISRGDQSGTHIRELELWKLSSHEPTGDWYIQANDGMLKSLLRASKDGGYILSDRSTFLFNEGQLNLVVVFEGDPRLFNPYGVIAVNPEKHNDAHFEEAMKFIEFVTSLEGQELIAGYGVVRYGKPLYTPLAVRKQTGIRFQ